MGNFFTTTKYCVWYRHSGQKKVDSQDWLYEDASDCTLAQMKEDIGDHTLTHLLVSGKFSSEIGRLAPELSHLCLYSPPESDVQKLESSLSELENLKELIITRANLSGNNLHFLSTLKHLKNLDLNDCQLNTLPTSLSPVQVLETLDLSSNDLADSDLKSLSLLKTLKELKLKHCKLKSLPDSFEQLTQLETLNLEGNLFDELPVSISKMTSLRTLDLTDNERLKSVYRDITQLPNLEELEIDACPAIEIPPIELCKQGPKAIKQYYIDLDKGAGMNEPFATIAVIGNTMSGKTSLVKTLQNESRKRVLTDRTSSAVNDEATRVFRFEEVKIEDMMLRFIDLGGHEVYHLTYQLTLRDNCVPIVVINIEQYANFSKKQQAKEGVRRLFFDWMSHLYVARPELRRPILVITHKDAYNGRETEYDKLKTELLSVAAGLRAELVDEEESIGAGDSILLQKVKHLSDLENQIFDPKDIYEVGNEENMYEVFDLIKRSLYDTCKGFVKPVPRSWELIVEHLKKMPGGVAEFDKVLEHLRKTDEDINGDQLKIVLRFMHDCGRLFWYWEIDALERYIFHKISSVTKLLQCVFHHNLKTTWDIRVDTSGPFLTHTGKIMEKEECRQLTKKFLDTGVLNSNILRHVTKTETEYKSEVDIDVALSLLLKFRLLYGPVTCEKEICYIIPYFCPDYQSNIQRSDKPSLNFRLELTFNGLSLPRYVYHQATIGVMELFPEDAVKPKVAHNGVTLMHNSVSIRLTHDFNTKKVTIEVTTRNVSKVSACWGHLKKITNNTLKHIKQTWKASRPVCKLYCTHCLLKDELHPDTELNPTWCALSNVKANQGDNYKDQDGGMESVECGNGDDDVPKILKFPCAGLSENEKLEKYIKRQRGRRTTGPNEASPERPPIDAGKSQVEAQSSIKEEDGTISNISSDEESDEDAEILKRILPTRLKEIKDLFDNSDKAYKMTPVRGRALVINNKNFESWPPRSGSENDITNIVELLTQLKFEVSKKPDLSAENILKVMQNETQENDHEDYGMFALVIMSHGAEKDLIYGSDGKVVDMGDIYDMLSSRSFSAMKSKPKLIIIQACSGARSDYCEVGESTRGPIREVPEIVRPQSNGATKQNGKNTIPRPERLSTDDLYIMKASFESYISLRDTRRGSIFIRSLVKTMYKHASHRDMHELYKIVQKRVKDRSLKLLNTDDGPASGQMVVATDTLSNGRKLYLFPGYDGPRG